MVADPTFTINSGPWAVHAGPGAARPHQHAPLWICSANRDPGWVKIPPQHIAGLIAAIVSGAPGFEAKDNAVRLHMQRQDGELRITAVHRQRSESVTIAPQSRAGIARTAGADGGLVDMNASSATIATMEAPLACGLVMRASVTRDEQGHPVHVDISRTSAGAPVYPLAPHNVSD